MPGKEPTEEELDKMIDQSVKDIKQDSKEKPKQDQKGEKKTEKQKEQPKEAPSSEKPAEVKQESTQDVKKDDKKQEKKPEEKKAEKEKPKLPAMKVVEGYDPWKVLQYPHLAEKSMNMVEMENKLVFVVRRDARKDKIKEAVEKGFGVRVLSVNVTITRKGHKKAYIKLDPNYSAADIATRLGMI
jgi:large subunit ribosomal protein L23